MISPVLIKPRYPGALTGPMARVIPGMHLWTAEVPRKKPVSVTLDGRYWNGATTEKVPQRPQQDLSPSWLRLLLPNFFFQAHCWKIAGPLLADFAIVSSSFALISILGMGKASANFSLALFSGAAVLPKSLAALLLSYFLMLTLLGHSEGVYASATPWSAQR